MSDVTINHLAAGLFTVAMVVWGGAVFLMAAAWRDERDRRGREMLGQALLDGRCWKEPRP